MVIESRPARSSAIDEPERTARDDDDDGDIVALIARGRDADHGQALRLLMQRHGKAVYRYCRDELHDRVLADDVHQQIFIEAHRDLTRFRARSTLRSWLFGIARHRVLDAAKSRRRAEAHIEDDDTADAPDPRPLPCEQLDQARLEDALTHCLGALGAHVRDALRLRYQQGFSFEDMADVCCEKPGTLQARVTRALPVLRACIEARTGDASMSSSSTSSSARRTTGKPP